jgi:hypothetical protein
MGGVRAARSEQSRDSRAEVGIAAHVAEKMTPAPAWSSSLAAKAEFGFLLAYVMGKITPVSQARAHKG